MNQRFDNENEYLHIGFLSKGLPLTTQFPIYVRVEKLSVMVSRTVNLRREGCFKVEGSHDSPNVKTVRVSLLGDAPISEKTHLTHRNEYRLR